MQAVNIRVAQVPGVPGEEGPPSYEVLAALVASLRRELAGARERIAELEARL